MRAGEWEDLGGLLSRIEVRKVLELLRPLVDPRIHLLVLALPLFEWWTFRQVMMAPWSSQPAWPSFFDMALLWGGHEFLFALTVFWVLGLGIPGGAVRFVRAALVPLGLVAIARVYMFIPWWMTRPAEGSGTEAFDRFLDMAALRYRAMYALDPLLLVCVVGAVRRHLRLGGRIFPGLRAISWPGFLFAAFLCVSSILRVVLARCTLGGPFGFAAWLADGPDVSVIQGAEWPHGKQLLETLLGAWLTVLPAVLLGRWLWMVSAQKALPEPGKEGELPRPPGDLGNPIAC